MAPYIYIPIIHLSLTHNKTIKLEVEYEVRKEKRDSYYNEVEPQTK